MTLVTIAFLSPYNSINYCYVYITDAYPFSLFIRLLENILGKVHIPLRKNKHLSPILCHLAAPIFGLSFSRTK